MPICFFTSDLHGSIDRYETLFRLIASERPGAVFLGGDLLPNVGGMAAALSAFGGDFLSNVVSRGLSQLRDALADDYPAIFVILGNDDPRSEEQTVIDMARQSLWHYIHARREPLGSHTVYGYSCIPPSPFRLKDWERYDVSQFVDPGCVAPEDGLHTTPIRRESLRFATIEKDLVPLASDDDLSDAIMLFHSPPYQTKLDRAALDGKKIDHAPVDVHIGSIALRRFIEARQPLITLHGHVHESARLTGAWRDRIGRTHLFSAAHDGPELALVRFDPESPEHSTRELL